MYFFYILYSSSIDKFYVSQRENLEERLYRHNSNMGSSTKNKGPWVCVYSELFPSRKEAVGRETQIKKMKSRKYIEKLIQPN